MNRIRGQKKAILEGNLTEQELITITGGETFVPIEDVNFKEPPMQALYGISPNPPICQPLYGIKPPIIQPLYGIKPPIIRPMYGVPVITK